MPSASFPQNRSKASSFITLIIFIVMLVGGIFFVKPLWDEVDSLSLGRDQKQAEKDGLSQQLTSLQALQQSLQQSSEVARNNMLNAIPQRFEQDKLLTDLSKIAQDNQILLNSVSFGVGTESTDRIKRATVNANLTGDVGSLLNFLAGVEANQRKLIVKNVSVQTGQTQTGIPQVNFNLSMETYYQDRI